MADIRLRAVVTFVAEYTADPANYGTENAVEASSIDQGVFEDDPASILNMPGTSVHVSVVPLARGDVCDSMSS